MFIWEDGQPSHPHYRRSPEAREVETSHPFHQDLSICQTARQKMSLFATFPLCDLGQVTSPLTYTGDHFRQATLMGKE